MTETETRTRLLDAADTDGPRSAALVHLLAYNGFRIDEILSAIERKLTSFRFQVVSATVEECHSLLSNLSWKH